MPTVDDQLEVFELDDELHSVGKISKNVSRLLDVPLSLPSGGFLAAFSDGLVMKLDPTGLPVGDPVNLGRQLQRGPFVVGTSVVVLTANGSMYSLNDLVNN